MKQSLCTSPPESEPGAVKTFGAPLSVRIIAPEAAGHPFGKLADVADQVVEPVHAAARRHSLRGFGLLPGEVPAGDGVEARDDGAGEARRETVALQAVLRGSQRATRSGSQPPVNRPGVARMIRKQRLAPISGRGMTGALKAVSRWRAPLPSPPSRR